MQRGRELMTEATIAKMRLYGCAGAADPSAVEAPHELAAATR